MKKNVLQTASKAAKLVVYSIKKTQFPVWLCILLNTVGYGQSTGNYALNTLTNGSLAQDLNSNTIDMSTGTTTLLAANVDDSPVSSLTNMNLGTGSTFDFYLMGTRYTSFGVSANGILTLGATPGTTVYALPNSTVPTISAFANDMQVGTDGNVIAKVVGTAPNRTLVIQWTNVMIRYTASNGPGTGTWQVRLYESSGIIEHVYGAMATNTATPALYYVGFSVNTAANNLVTLNTNTNVANTTATATTNSYTASSTITDLNSTSNGSRKIYRFTPPSVAAPTSLTFTGVTLTGMTLNWTAASPITGVQKYAVYRSSDGGVTYSFVNTTNVGTNTLAITGLTPGTTYMYQVYSVSEGALSTALTGSQATNAPANYVWNQTGSAAFGTAANWTPNRTTTDVTDILVFNNGATTTVTGITTQTVGQIQISGNTTVSFQTAASNTLTTGGLNIASGSTLILNSASTQGLTLSSGGTASIAGALNISASNTYTTTGNTSVSGTVTNNGGTVSGATTTTLTFTSTGTFVHNMNGGTIPTATYTAGSNVNVTGITTTAPTPPSTIGGNFIWNCSLQTGSALSLLSTLTTVGGTCTIQSTGSGSMQFGTSPTLAVSGLFTISGGTLLAAGGTLTLNGGLTVSGGTINATSATTINVNGNFTQSAGLITSASATASILTLNVTGALNQSGGTISQTSTGSLTINFTGTANQAVTLNGTNTTGIINYRINNGNNNGITLTGTLPINNNANLTVSIGGTPITGGTVTYGTSSTTLVYANTSASVTPGMEWPSSNSPVNLTLNLTGAAPNNRLNMPGSRTLSGVVTLTSGVLNLGSFDLTLSNSSSGAISVTTPGATKMVAADGSGLLRRAISTTANTTYLFPVGDITGTIEYSPASLTMVSNSATRTIGVRVVNAQHPSDASADYLRRYWVFTDDGGSNTYTYNGTFTYVAADINGAESNMRLSRWNGSAWNQIPSTVASNTGTILVNQTLATAPLGGSEITGRTLVNTTYVWQPTTGSADFQVAANWSPTRSMADNTDILSFSNTGTTTVTNVPTQTIARLVFANSTTASLQTSATNTLTIGGGVGTDLDIPSGSALDVNSSFTLNISFAASTTGLVNGTLTVSSTGSGTLNFTNSVTTINGVLNLSNANYTLTSSASNLFFGSGSSCNMTTTSTTIPIATWNATSTLTLSGIVGATSATNAAQSFGNVVYNCSSATGTMSFFTTNIVNIQGDLTISATNTGKFRCVTSGTLSVSGNLVISGSSICDLSSSSGTVNVLGNFTHSSTGTTTVGFGSGGTLNVTGGFNVSAGTFDLASSGATTVRVGGTFNQTGGTITESSTSTASVIEFNGSASQSVTLGTINNTISYRVNNNAGISLTGTMAITTGAGLIISSTAATPISGGSVTYTGTTTLTYNATTGAQTAGLEFPASGGPTNLTINNTATSPNNTVAVSGNRSISGTLTLTAGILQMGANTLTLTGTTTGAVSGGGASAYVSGGLERTLPASLASGSTYTFPIGKGTYNLFELVNPTTNAGGTVVVRAEVFDANAGGAPGTGIDILNTNRYWQAAVTGGAGSLTNTTVRLTESGVTSANRIGQSATLTGVYNSIGASLSGSTLLSNSITSLNFFVIGAVAIPAGTYTVCASGCNYTSLTNTSGAFADINSKALLGNVVLQINGDLTGETGANGLNQWLESPANSNYTLTIQPTGGVTRTISGSTSSTALMNLNGADRVTINGLNTGGNALLIRNTNTSAATIRFINDATNNTIQNCTIEGNATSTTSGVVLLSSGTATGNDNNTLTGNLIRDRSDATGVPANGIYSAGTSASIANSDNIITNNQIFNWTASGVTISATGNGDNWNISNNSLYQTATRSTALTGIALLSAANGNTVSNNSIGGADANRSGATMTGSEFYGINLSVGTTTATSVQGNILGNITTTSTTANQYGIGISSGNANIGTVSGNTIGEATANSINVANSFDGIFVSSAGSVDMRNNLIRNLKYDAADFERLSGIYATGGIVTIKDNTIRDLIHRGTTTSSTTTNFCPWGIRVASTTSGNLIEGNTIFNISLEFNGANSTSTYPMYGIGVTGAVTNTTVTRNRIYNLTTTRTGTTTSAPPIFGLYANAGAVTYSNNQISIAQSTASTQPLIRGILLESTANNNFYYNSVYIGGSAAAANNTFGFLRNSTSGTQTLYNNLLYNERGGTGAHYAIGNNSTTGWSTNVTNDYNLLVTANSANLGLWVSTASTFSAWRTSSGSDTYSWSDLNTNVTPANLFTDHTTGNLNIQVANVESWYVAGKGVQISGLSADFGDLSANRPTTVPAGATDIGSDEIGTPGIAPHALTAVPALGVTNFTFAGRTVASVNWVSGTLPSTITTRYYSGETPPNPTCSNASAQYADAYWDITPDVTSGYVFDLSLVYTPAILGTIPAETDGRLSENELLCWQGYPASTVNTTAKTVTQTGLSTFSLWTISAANALLPIELVRFDAIENGPANRIEWATASEVDLRRFVVERSSDGIQFRDWAEATPQGQPGVPATYALDDKEPPVVAYYRLRSENLDGSFDYSKVVVVARKVEKLRLLALYPSPAEEQITLQLAGLENSDAQVLVLRLDGTFVQQQTIGIQAGLNTLLLDVQALPAGMYQVILLGERQSTAPLRFVKL